MARVPARAWPRHFVVPTWVGRGSDRVVLGGGRDLLGPNSTLNPFPLALPKLPRSGDSLQPGLRIGEVLVISTDLLRICAHNARVVSHR